MGCANYHGWIIFNDGEKWIVRIPRTQVFAGRHDLLEYFVESEYATLKFLESTSIPAPRAFGYGLASDPGNAAGVSYLFIEAMPGKPYLGQSKKQKARCLAQLADILIEISKHPMTQAGSLAEKNGSINMSSVASNRWVVLGLYGPFSSPTDYYTSIIDQYLDLIMDGQLYSSIPKDAFLYYAFLRENIPKLVGDQEGSLSGNFYLKHVDDKGDHILIDEDGNITGIIDWQFARFVPPGEAFGPSYVTADMDKAYGADPGIVDDDKFLAEELRKKGAFDLALYMEKDERQRRFSQGLASGSEAEFWDDLILGTMRAFRDEEDPPMDLTAWRKVTEEKYRKDARWKQLLARLEAEDEDRIFD